MSEISDMKDMKDMSNISRMLSENLAKICDYEYDIKSLEKQYISVKGHVQSGKTEFMTYMSTLLLTKGFSVIIMLRNMEADREQIYKRITNFYKDYKIDFSVIKKLNHKNFAKKVKNIPQMYFVLGNMANLKILNRAIGNGDFPFVLFIDEVDYTDSGNGCKSSYIKELKEKSYCVFGVSATIMDFLIKENVSSKNLILLKPSSNYKGFINNKICTKEISSDCIYSSKITTNLFESVPILEDFIKEYCEKPIYNNNHNNHPNICLFTITRCIEPCIKAQETISEKFPNVSTIVYNSNGISFSKGEVKIVDRKSTISEFLQKLKEEGNHSHILIFSGDMASRGISFVSSDYSWHLTDQMILVAEKTDEPELIQKIRLCGKYNDDISLTLYSTKRILDDLKKSYLRQEEYIFNTKENKDDKKLCREIIDKTPMSSFKFTSRKMIKSNETITLNKVKKATGWSSAIYNGDNLPPKKSFDLYGIESKDDEKKEISNDLNEDNKEEIYVNSKDVSKQTKETFELIQEYFRENYKNGWVQRTSISKYFKDRGVDDNTSRLNARFEHIIAKGTNKKTEDSIVFKKNGSRWLVRII